MNFSSGIVYYGYLSDNSDYYDHSRSLNGVSLFLT